MRLTPAGKIQIFKCLALSKTLYACTMLTPTKKFIDQLNSLKKDSICRGKRPKINHLILVRDYEKGSHLSKDHGIKDHLD